MIWDKHSDTDGLLMNEYNMGPDDDNWVALPLQQVLDWPGQGASYQIR